MKLGVIDVGGGVRGSYGAGVLDYCMDRGISFDYGIGVSAGAANIVSYLAGQRGRNYRFYTDYAFRPQYMGVGNFIRSRNYIGLDYIYTTLSAAGGEDPLDFRLVQNSEKELLIVATDARTGEPVYFDAKKDMDQDDYDAIKGSCCVPVVNKPYPVHGIPCYDGGISDPVPLEKAFADGCDHVALILTRPRDDYRTAEKDIRMARFLRKYPASARKMADRSTIYNEGLDLAKKYEAEGKVTIIAPADISGMKTLTKDRNAIAKLYSDGYEDAKVLDKFL